MGGVLSQADTVLKMFWYVEAIKLIDISRLTVSSCSGHLHDLD